MIRIDDISYSVSGRQLISGASVVIPDGHKVGIVGRNGTGKTTLFHLLTGKLALDDGAVELPRKARIGGVSQEVPSNEVSLLNTVLAADTERAELLAESETATDPTRISQIHERLADIDAYSAEARAASILSGLGFDAEAQARACSEFSGGWRMRVALAAVLFSEPDILLLDEPTNYLDLEGTIWLETYLAKYPHTVLVISHDRTLLNKSVTSILHLHDKNLTLYTGNYDTFDSVRRARLAEQAAMAKKQEAARDHLQSFVDRFRAKASKAKQAQSRLKMLERMEPIASSVENGVASFSFPNPDELSSPIVRLDEVNVGYDDTPILRKLNLRIDANDRIALLGANGQGKSTLSKLLASKLEPMGGDWIRSSKLKIGYFAQHQVDELHLDETPLQHIAREIPTAGQAKQRARLAAGGIGPEQADTLVGKLSGGQKARLSMLLATLDSPHLVILDEPTNHLDIESREALALALASYEGAVVLVSHDPHLINAIADQLWLVKDGTVLPFNDDMEAYKKLLLAERGGTAKAKDKIQTQKVKKADKGPKPATIVKRKNLQPLQADVTKCEERVTKIEEMKGQIERRLANPSFYASDDPAKIAELSKKHAEIIQALKKAEILWERATVKLDAAKES
ncbi:glycosyl transferase family 1 [Amylibacter ulvae]|uniref:Glycosyl transferase family 1 n=1 Tax=Paramylibacter ulvae TaxID=1651968 RepID=A0ABQ3CR95_9RHOB|nr:ABC-F family ATP-binding cassette domain-containing protein [Amylibacter ulvae]GHA40444.1 glycosyl transferase family 1 [Amylibacter ulvae]